MRMNRLTHIVAAAAILGVGIASYVEPAAARVVCNSYGDCWHTDARDDYNKYDRDQRAQYHNDDWYFHQRWESDKDHHWRDYHDGRGYYKNGIWIQL